MKSGEKPQTTQKTLFHFSLPPPPSLYTFHPQLNFQTLLLITTAFSVSETFYQRPCQAFINLFTLMLVNQSHKNGSKQIQNIKISKTNNLVEKMEKIRNNTFPKHFPHVTFFVKFFFRFFFLL